MYAPVYSKRFEKDIKKMSRSGAKDMDKLKSVVRKLLAGEKLGPKYRNHLLLKNWKDHFECHIEPDWVLIYKIDNMKGEIYFARTGSHSELFG